MAKVDQKPIATDRPSRVKAHNVISPEYIEPVVQEDGMVNYACPYCSRHLLKLRVQGTVEIALPPCRTCKNIIHLRICN